MDDFETNYRLGLRYLHGIGVNQDLEKAFMYIKRSAYQGYVRAQVSLAFIYLYGIGVTENKHIAFIYFKMAAGEYHVRSELMVGMMYEYGDGIKYGENMDKALIYYKRADKQGNQDAKDKVNILK